MIGYYGGSFDPIHNGHVEIARYIAGFDTVKSVCFVPAGAHPLGKQISEFHHRMQMINLAINGIQGLEASDADCCGEGPSYTIHLLHRLKQIEKMPFFFIAGMDNLNQFFEWKNWEEILLTFPIAFTSRAGVDPDKDAVKRISKTIGKAIPIVNELDSEFSGPAILKVPDINISSSEIRKMILNGELPSGMIHSDVLDYIETHDLYRKG
ncbi:MAG: nicotinate (nicotinamide) nucleotide adenylyltransferase [Acidobacteria bacterium]|nr:MAG: nicotinate (nicotinamide) nucleotide adenylyltransferase [Acidobacteriota bacterium]RLE24387.1 MAG: nicotinate (nicotinamide) nucleotide adenylyltransferase [Acidobacteriota bacterium]